MEYRIIPYHPVQDIPYWSRTSTSYWSVPILLYCIKSCTDIIKKFTGMGSATKLVNLDTHTYARYINTYNTHAYIHTYMYIQRMTHSSPLGEDLDGGWDAGRASDSVSRAVGISFHTSSIRFIDSRTIFTCIVEMRSECKEHQADVGIQQKFRYRVAKSWREESKPYRTSGSRRTRGKTT